MGQVIILVNDIGVNASHYGSMEKDEAVKKMIDDGISKDKKWAAKVYDLCIEGLKK